MLASGDAIRLVRQDVSNERSWIWLLLHGFVRKRTASKAGVPRYYLERRNTMDSELAPRRRQSFSAAARQDAYERTNKLARETIEEERRKRNAKTEQLRLARLRATSARNPDPD